jgi:hypothetical protein
MKPTDKEWLAFAFRVIDSSNAEDVDLYKWVGPKSVLKWKRDNPQSRMRLGAYESEVRYFAAIDQAEQVDENEKEPLSVQVVRSNRQLRFVYPVLSWRLRLQRHAVLLVAVP